MNEKNSQYGKVQTTEDLGRLVRSHRKRKQLTLESASGLANLSVRFLSEFERGKDTAEIGKVLKALNTLGLDVIVQPRKGTGVGTRTSVESPINSPDDLDRPEQ